MYTGVALIVGAFGLFALVVVVLVDRAARRRRAAFRATCRALGLTERRDAHWTGTVDGRAVVVGAYSGTRSTSAVGTGGGLLVMVHIGLLPGGRNGANLSSTPPGVWGPGEGADALTPLLDPPVLEPARALAEVVLFPADALVEGSLLDRTIREHWPEGWRGLALRAILPTGSDREATAQGIAALAAVADRMVSALGASGTADGRRVG